MIILMGIILDTFPGFCDYCINALLILVSDGWEAVGGDWRHFYKRVRIAVADLWAVLGRCHCGLIESSDASSNDYLTWMCQFDNIYASWQPSPTIQRTAHKRHQVIFWWLHNNLIQWNYWSMRSYHSMNSTRGVSLVVYVVCLVRHMLCTSIV